MRYSNCFKQATRVHPKNKQKQMWLYTDTQFVAFDVSKMKKNIQINNKEKEIILDTEGYSITQI